MADTICIVGLGYVGLPLAVAFSEKYPVIGYDQSVDRVCELKNGFDRTLELDSESIKAYGHNISFTSDPQKIQSNIYIVTVPTPIDKHNRPDLSPLQNASEKIGNILSKGDIVIYESTVYPGVTEEVCVPILQINSGLQFNIDFFVGYSPERINPGDKNNKLADIVKVTSGSTVEVADRVDQLYNTIISAGTHKASSIKVAEASKVIENTQRDVNIALINELALIFDHMNIDTTEVLEAASSKWNFIKFSPGLVGGHCIGVDPYYLTFKAEELGYKPNLILSSRLINNSMSSYIVEKTIKKMIQNNHLVNGANILIMGVTFKENCPDTRNSKVWDIINELLEYGVNVDVYDPWVNMDLSAGSSASFVDDPRLKKKKYNALIVAVGHSKFKEWAREEFDRILLEDAVTIDVKDVLYNPTWRL